jgi:hypothetical protein
MQKSSRWLIFSKRDYEFKFLLFPKDLFGLARYIILVQYNFIELGEISSFF